MNPDESRPLGRPGPPCRRRPEKPAYQEARRDRSHPVYFASVAAKESARTQAEAAGYHRNLSAFILDKYYEALSGQMFDPAMVDRLREEKATLKEWLEAANAQIAALTSEIRTLRDQRDTLARLLLDTAEGVERAKAFLAEKDKSKGGKA